MTFLKAFQDQNQKRGAAFIILSSTKQHSFVEYANRQSGFKCDYYANNKQFCKINLIFF